MILFQLLTTQSPLGTVARAKIEGGILRSRFEREALLKINCDGGGGEGDCQHDAKAAGGLRHNAEKHGDEMEAILGLAGERREELAKFVKIKRITTQGLRFVTVEVCFFLQSHFVRPDYCIFYADPGQQRAAAGCSFLHGCPGNLQKKRLKKGSNEHKF